MTINYNTYSTNIFPDFITTSSVSEGQEYQWTVVNPGTYWIDNPDTHITLDELKKLGDLKPPIIKDAQCLDGWDPDENL